MTNQHPTYLQYAEEAAAAALEARYCALASLNAGKSIDAQNYNLQAQALEKQTEKYRARADQSVEAER